MGWLSRRQFTTSVKCCATTAVTVQTTQQHRNCFSCNAVRKARCKILHKHDSVLDKPASQQAKTPLCRKYRTREKFTGKSTIAVSM